MTQDIEIVQALPVLPLKNTVLFPRLFMPLSVGRPNSLAAIEATLATEEKTFLAVAQRDSSQDGFDLAELYGIGTRAVVKKLARGDGIVEILVQGIERVAIIEATQTTPFLIANVRPLPWPDDSGTEVEALHRAVIELAARVLELAQLPTPISIQQLATQANDPLQLVYLLGSLLGLEVAKEQALLEAKTRAEALTLMHGYLSHEVQVLELRNKIASQAQSEMGKQQREFVLRQQLRAIQEELGEKSPEKSEVDELRRRLGEVVLPEAARKEAERELNRLERLPAAAPDFQMTRTYIELLLELPWTQATADTVDLAHAQKVLNEDHFGLDEVKDRILEDLAVMKMNPQGRAPILLLVGPPGVGKTSLGQSIARALGRKFERLSLGGLHDEAELRGHRRTYIGAMPGRLLQGLRRAGVNNPVLLLDEVDKLGHDFRGDPAAALLEVLDPAQNDKFRDNYLDLPFDLSKVFFILTANAVDTIPRPLLDRLEVLRLAGYSEEEKGQIARRYLLPRQRAAAGLKETDLMLADDVVRRVISRYTREAGVRDLERALGRISRKVARRFAEGNTTPAVVGLDNLVDLLGPERVRPERYRTGQQTGVATGLAWTEAGGDVLYIEATLLRDGKGLRLTGQLGEVMKESAKAAQAFIWSHAHALGIDPDLFRNSAVHVHVPAGAVPKDGPSAGVAMVTALASAYSGIPARGDVAMTGEVTLTGLVLPVGGVKEKVLAARRAGIRKVVLPADNEVDLRELPDNVRQEMHFTFAERVEDALAVTLPEVGQRLQKLAAV